MTTSSMHTALAYFLATLLAASCSASGQLPIVPPPAVPALASTASIRNDHGLDWVAISPDGKWVGSSSTGDEVYLKEIATGREVVQHGLDSGDNEFDGFFAGGSGFAWLSDSSGVLVTRGLRKREEYGPAVISLDGALTDHPTVALPEAPLSALLYIGNDGKAVATLGSHGQFQGRDPVMETPMLAFVDIRTNRILQSIRYAEIFPADAESTPVMHMSSGVVLPDGRMKFVAVFSAHGPRKPRFIWLVWTQGEQPRIMHQSENPEGSIIGLSPDGRGVILVSRLMARSPCADDGPCNSPSIPTTGEIARYLDTEDGHVLWRIHATAHGGYGLTKPAFSPDGRHVILGWPTLSRQGMPVIATTSDGSIVRKLASPSPQYLAGFTADGRRIWVQGYETLTWFDFDVAAGS